MLIQQSLQNESESVGTESNDQIQPVNDIETNAISDTTPESNSPSVDIDKSELQNLLDLRTEGVVGWRGIVPQALEFWFD